MPNNTRAPRWTPEQATQFLDQADASGISDRAFAEQAGITEQRISWWRMKLDRRKRPGRRPESELQAKPRFMELTNKPRSTSPVEQIEVRLANGRCVLVPPTMDPLSLRSLLETVEGLTC